MTTSTRTTEEVIDLIEKNDDAASGAVAQLDTYCQQDEIGRTPLNTAIEFNNRDIIALITESGDAIDYFPRIDEYLINPVKHTVTDAVNEGQVADTEKYLVACFGERMRFQRTPLHTACRYANQEAMSTLVSRKADVNARDILGLTPLELAIELGGPDTATAFLDACKENERNVDISDFTLRMACANPGLYRQVVQEGNMDKKARRFAFNLSAALLDEDAMEQLLQAGMKIKDAFGPELNPIREVCTSRLLSVYEHPEAPRLAGQYAAATDFGGSTIHVDNDDINNAQTLEEIHALFRNAEKKEEDKKRRQTSYTLSDDEQQALLKKRIALINLLTKSGATAKMIQRKAPYGFASDIVSMGSPEILQALANIGVTLAPEEDGPSELVSALVDSNFGMIDPLIQMGHEWTGEENNHPELLREYRKWKKDNESDVVQLNLPEEKADTLSQGALCALSGIQTGPGNSRENQCCSRQRFPRRYSQANRSLPG